ncbi:hypothetical protein HAX54_006376, partial [Datura stramonium]|nr:hypothetical protein [Datura stramonium]
KDHANGNKGKKLCDTIDTIIEQVIDLDSSGKNGIGDTIKVPNVTKIITTLRSGLRRFFGLKGMMILRKKGVEGRGTS